ncbi:hypothetical protein [Polaribacter sp. Asnod1-A03]|uniref:hypothetical protein n=1 Tax=Polaribacter sp. Asnod1-A03 TaxID=3160581 RepID=UPI00386BA53B
MKNQNLLEKIVLYGSVFAIILILATLFRHASISMGNDDVTSSIVFVIIFILGTLSYLMIHLGLIEILKIFTKKEVIDQGENKKVNKIVEKRDEEAENKVVEKSEEENKNKVVEKVKEIDKDEIENKNVVKSDDDELSKIFDKKYQEKIRIEKQKLEKAIQYTKERFTLYLSREDLAKLCKYIEVYSKQGNYDTITPIEVSQLKYFDVNHFGWNIWNYFNTPNNSITQIKIAKFLKNIFEELYKNVEVHAIKTRLKEAPDKGIIKIEEDITNLTEHNQSA